MRMENLLVRDVERILNGRIYLVRLLLFSSFVCGVEMGREWGFFLVISGVSFFYDSIGEQRYTTTRVALLPSPSY